VGVDWVSNPAGSNLYAMLARKSLFARALLYVAMLMAVIGLYVISPEPPAPRTVVMPAKPAEHEAEISDALELHIETGVDCRDWGGVLSEDRKVCLFEGKPQ